jgi:maleylpyruvate isomerase
VNSPYLGRIDAATARLLATVVRIDDAAVVQPSLLPGWDRAMVLKHLSANAVGLARVVEAASRGEVTELYPGGPAARDAEIEAGRGAKVVDLESELRQSAESAMAALRLAPDEVLRAPAVHHRLGEVPVGQLVIARLREVEVHHVDLDFGYSPSDWPLEWVLEEMDRAMVDLPSRLPRGVAVVLAATGTDQHWVAGSGEAIELEGTVGELFAWVTGRAVTVGGTPAPELGPWR